MKHDKLRNKLTTSLSRLYDMEVISNLSEFFQGELHVLQFLSQRKDSEINPSILSDALHVSRSRITSALSALRRKGYVAMEICENDRRRMRVLITPKGAAFIKAKQDMVESYFETLIEGLGEQKVKELIQLIDGSVEVMDKV